MFAFPLSKIGYKHKTIPVVHYSQKPVTRTRYETRYKTESYPVHKTDYVPVKKVDYVPYTR